MASHATLHHGFAVCDPGLVENFDGDCFARPQVGLWRRIRFLALNTRVTRIHSARLELGARERLSRTHRNWRMASTFPTPPSYASAYLADEVVSQSHICRLRCVLDGGLAQRRTCFGRDEERDVTRVCIPDDVPGRGDTLRAHCSTPPYPARGAAGATRHAEHLAE